MDDPARLPPPPALAELMAREALALFLDFDGTLVDIAPAPDAIEVPRGLGLRLAGLSGRLEGRLALVSGRAISDLEHHCGPLEIACAGSHGAERRSIDGAEPGTFEPLPGALVGEIERWAVERSVTFEGKPKGAALHSRERPEREEECALFLGELAARHGLRVKRGKRVAELVRPGADKGAAVRAFMAAPPFSGSLPVFVGDDLTDEDGFAACVALGGFGIAVGERPAKKAGFALADPAAVQHWLGL